MSETNQKGNFFFFYSLLLLLIAIGGFLINGIVNKERMPPVSAMLILHITVMYLWYLLVVFQSWLIKSGNYSLHMNLGKLSSFLALALVISGAFTVANSYPRETQKVAVLTYNFFILSLFSIFYYLAIYKRKSSASHKRLILFTSLAVLHPALFRIDRIFDSGISLGLLLILMFVILVYDIRTIKKIHTSTIFGFITTTAAFAIMTMLIFHDGWNEFLKSFLI